MKKWLVYYYKAWTGHNSESILTEFDDFSQGIKYPFDEASVAQFKGNIYKYWCWVRDAYPEIGTVVVHMFGICVNAASVERLLWSTDINYNRRNNQQESANNTMTENKNKNKNDNENEIGDENENERYLQNEELNDNDLNNDQGSIDLKENLNSQFNNHLNECESKKDFSDINVEDIEHPAENIDAKWKLEFIFEDNLFKILQSKEIFQFHGQRSIFSFVIKD
ncbi:ribonuclease H-like domain-containing protein [Rhizophagus irregularis DAOM 181602=DAOM 197198]|nr:ribonuclease H-like domain-containing protein [Rhizophagus irregularis DAOM 181602=DAOM 197198]